MEVAPFKFNVNALVIFDRVTNYGETSQVSMSDVLAENGKHYNVWNPLFQGTGDQKEIKGVVRSSLKNVFTKVGNNIYNKAHTLILGNEKLPKTTQALAGLLNPIVLSVQGTFPFNPDFVLSSQQLSVVVETETGTSEAPIIEKQKEGDAKFSDFVSVDGWVTTSNATAENPVSNINLTTSVKFLATHCTIASITSDIGTMFKLIEKECPEKAHVGVLFDTNALTKDDSAFISALIGSGFTIYTSGTKATEKWLPTTKTALEDKVFRSLGGKTGDLLLIK